MKIRKDVVSTLNTLCDKTGLDLCLAGGAVRDMLHEIPFKDLDFEVLNYDFMQYGVVEYDPCVVRYTEELSELLESNGATELQIFTAYEGADIEMKVNFIIKFKYNGFDCDIICREEEPSTPHDVFKQYDMALNQVAIHKGQLVIDPDFGVNPIVSTGKRIYQSRLDRLLLKYSQYDFSDVIQFVVPDDGFIC